MGYPIFHSQYTAAQIEASIGKTPRIKSSTRTWEIWDIATSAYVDTGVSIDTQLYVDPTLTESGYAADAKVTGDKIGELKSAFNYSSTQVDAVMPTLIGNQIINPKDFEVGSIYIPASPPWNYEWSNKRVRTANGFYYDVKKGDQLYLSDYTDAAFSAFVESADDYNRSGTKTSGKYTVPFDGKLRFWVANQTEKVLSTSDVNDLISRVRIIGTNGLVQTTEQYNENNDVNISKLFARMQNEDGIVNIDVSDFEIGTIYYHNSSTPWEYQYSSKRVRSKSGKQFQLPSGAVISLSTYSGYRLSVQYESNGVYYDSGWKTEDFILPVNANVVLMISANPEVTVTDVSDYTDLLSIRTRQQAGNKTYVGPKIVTKNKGYTWMGSGFSVPAVATINSYGFSTTSFQAIAYYNGYIVVSYSDNVLAICNATTGAIVSVISAEIGHGNAMQFSNVFYDADDAFPLLYVTKSMTTGTTTVAVIRIATTAAATTIKIISFDGNYGNCAIDNITGHMVVVTYQAASYSVESGNGMDIKRYDISGETPVLLSSNVLDFIPIMQDSEIINGMMFIVSYGLGATPAVKNKIYVVDIDSLTIRNILTDFDNYYANINEVEGATFVNGDLYSNAGTGTRKGIFLE